MTLRHLAEHIRERRDALGLTELELARRARVAVSVIEHLEDGRMLRVVPIDAYHHVLESLGISPQRAHNLLLLPAGEHDEVKFEALRLLYRLRRVPEQFYRAWGYAEALRDQAQPPHQSAKPHSSDATLAEARQLAYQLAQDPEKFYRAMGYAEGLRDSE